MKKHIIIGILLGMLVPLIAIIVNLIFPFKYDYIFLSYNPFSWVFIFPGMLCQNELCADLIMVIGYVFAGWGILGGVTAILIYWIKKRLNKNNSKNGDRLKGREV